MTSGKTARVALFIMGMAACGMAQAFVGMIAVSLGQMDRHTGEVKTSFSADATLEAEDTATTTHIHYKPGMVRDEIEIKGHEMVTIHRFDLNKVWMLMGEGMYMEIDPDKGSKEAPQYKLISREVIGPEEVNGIPATKYESIYESEDGKFSGFTWYTKDNIAVKALMIQEKDGKKHQIKFEFLNLKREAQSDDLFEIPEGYHKFDMGGFAGMQEMMKGGMMETQTTPAAGTHADDDNNFAAEMADEAQQTAEDAAKDETKQGIRDTLRKGFGSLFGR